MKHSVNSRRKGKSLGFGNHVFNRKQRVGFKIMDISQVLKSRTEKYKSTAVENEADRFVDEHNLLVIDAEPRSSRDEIHSRTRENIQILVNNLWKLPVRTKDDAILASLPKQNPQSTATLFPREKPVPKPKPPTKWEVFAKEKGIVKRKRERMIYDESSQEYKPRYGYKGINQNDKPWVIPLSDHADPYDDPYAKLAEAKKARVEKNEKQRVKNLKMANKLNGFKATTADEIVSAVEDKEAKRQEKKEKLIKGLTATKFATASVGKFDKKLEDEPKQLAKKKSVGNRQQRAPVVGDIKSEKSRYLNLLGKITSKSEVLNVTKAANRALYADSSSSSAGGSDRPKVMKQGKKKSSAKAAKSRSGKMGAKKKFGTKGKIAVKGLGKKKMK